MNTKPYLHVFPARWRARYGAELAALIEDTGSNGHPRLTELMSLIPNAISLRRYLERNRHLSIRVMPVPRKDPAPPLLLGTTRSGLRVATRRLAVLSVATALIVGVAELVEDVSVEHIDVVSTVIVVAAVVLGVQLAYSVRGPTETQTSHGDPLVAVTPRPFARLTTLRESVHRATQSPDAFDTVLRPFVVSLIDYRITSRHGFSRSRDPQRAAHLMPDALARFVGNERRVVSASELAAVMKEASEL